MTVINIVVYLLYSLNSLQDEFNIKVQKWCPLSFQDSTFKLSQKLQFQQFWKKLKWNRIIEATFFWHNF